MSSRPPKIERTAEELEQISAEGRDWYADGYDYADEYVKKWKDGKIALGKPVEEQPESGFANQMWRQGFNARIHEHLMATLSRTGLSAGQNEVQRWQQGIANALGPH